MIKCFHLVCFLVKSMAGSEDCSSTSEKNRYLSLLEHTLQRSSCFILVLIPLWSY